MPSIVYGILGMSPFEMFLEIKGCYTHIHLPVALENRRRYVNERVRYRRNGRSVFTAALTVAVFRASENTFLRSYNRTVKWQRFIRNDYAPGGHGYVHTARILFVEYVAPRRELHDHWFIVRTTLVIISTCYFDNLPSYEDWRVFILVFSSIIYHRLKWDLC